MHALERETKSLLHECLHQVFHIALNNLVYTSQITVK